MVATTIAQAGAIGNQRGSNNFQSFEAHNPLALKGGGDPMVAGHCFRLVRKDTGASAKRKENQSSSSSRKKHKTSISYGFQELGHDYQSQGRVGASSQTRHMTCYHCHQPGWAHETRLSTKAGISELWDITVPIINATCADAVCSSLPQHGLREPMSVSGCCTSSYYFADRPHGPGHGSRSRSRLPDRYLGT